MDAKMSGIMVSNLPLLFVDGKLTSLENMPLASLSQFLPFLIRCSVNPNSSMQIGSFDPNIPEWWPDGIPVNITDINVESVDRSGEYILRQQMMKCVESCYEHHGCTYLLKFCSELASSDKGHFTYHDNYDGSTSLFDRQNSKLLVTFRNENMNYDRNIFCHSPRKSLLHRSPSKIGDASFIMVEPVLQETYLCYRCSAKFDSIQFLQTHEKNCNQGSECNSRLSSPEPENYDCIDECQFFSFLDLTPQPHSGLKPCHSNREIHRVKDAKVFGQSYHRFSVVPLTSPLGVRILNNSKSGLLTSSHHYVARYERYTCENVGNKDIVCKEDKWPITYRHPKSSSRKLIYPWSHSLCFNYNQRLEKSKIWRTGLTKRSRLLKRLCRPVFVQLKKLSYSEVLVWTRPALKTILKLPPQLSLIPLDSAYSRRPIKTIISDGIIVDSSDSPEVIDLVSSDEECGPTENCSFETYYSRSSRTVSFNSRSSRTLSYNSRSSRTVSYNSVYNDTITNVTLDGKYSSRNCAKTDLPWLPCSSSPSKNGRGHWFMNDDDAIKRGIEANGWSGILASDELGGTCNASDFDSKSSKFDCNAKFQNPMLTAKPGYPIVSDPDYPIDSDPDYPILSDPDYDYGNSASGYMNTNVLKPFVDLNSKWRTTQTVLKNKCFNTAMSEGTLLRYLKLPLVCLLSVKKYRDYTVSDSGDKSDTDSMKSTKENMNNRVAYSKELINLFNDECKGFNIDRLGTSIQCCTPLTRRRKMIGHLSRSIERSTRELKVMTSDRCKEFRFHELNTFSHLMSQGRVTRQYLPSAPVTK